MGLNGHIFDCNKMVYCLYNNDLGRQREEKNYDEKLLFLTKGILMLKSL